MLSGVLQNPNDLTPGERKFHLISGLVMLVLLLTVLGVWCIAGHVIQSQRAAEEAAEEAARAEARTQARAEREEMWEVFGASPVYVHDVPVVAEGRPGPIDETDSSSVGPVPASGYVPLDRDVELPQGLDWDPPHRHRFDLLIVAYPYDVIEITIQEESQQVTVAVHGRCGSWSRRHSICNPSRLTVAAVSLDEPLGNRVVVDGITGERLPRLR